MQRHGMSRHKSKKYFSGTAGHHPTNNRFTAMRGGFRL